MNFFIHLFETRPSLLIRMLGLLFFTTSIILYIIFYIYMNVNLNNISKIIFNNEKKYNRPLEPFNFIFLSFLPTTFWREILNLKYNAQFKKLYKKDFYYSLNKAQLYELLKNHKTYFILQYAVFILSALAIILVISCYILENFLNKIQFTS